MTTNGSSNAADTLCPIINDLKIAEVSGPSVRSVPINCLINEQELAMGDQGIDISYTPGRDSNRPIGMYPTPSGMKSAIVLDNVLVDSDVDSLDFIPYYDMPELGNVWSSTLQQGILTTEDVVVAPFLSQRTKYIMDMTQYHRGHIIARLICKPAMTQSQHVWVSRTFPFTEGGVENVGFSWNVSKCNEIFVVLPHTTPYFAINDVDLGSTHGSLSISAVSTLVSVEGNDLPLQVTIQFAPLYFRLAGPNPIYPIVPSLTGLHSMDILCNPAVTYQPNTYRHGQLTVVDPVYVSLGTLNCDSLGQVMEVTFIWDTAENPIIASCSMQPTLNALEYRGLLAYLPPGVYRFEMRVFTHPLKIDSSVSCSIIYTGVNIPVWAPPSRGQYEICNEALDGVKFDNLDVVNVMDRIKKCLADSNKSISFEYSHDELELENPYQVRAFIDSPNKPSQLLFCAHGEHFDGICVEELSRLFRWNTFEKQIKEWSYNPLSTCATANVGGNPEHINVEKDHFQYMSSFQVTPTNKEEVFSYILNPRTFKTRNFWQANRFEFMSSYPTLAIRCNKNMYSNLILRVCQLPAGVAASRDALWQLPGKEWDPSLQDMTIQPYWNLPYPAVNTPSVNIHILVVSGSIDVSGLSLGIYVNSSSIGLHVPVDYDLHDPDNLPPPVAFDMTKMCTDCFCLPCSCGFIRQESSDYVKQGDVGIAPIDDPTPHVISPGAPAAIFGGSIASYAPVTAPSAGSPIYDKQYLLMGSMVVQVKNVAAIAIPIKSLNFGKSAHLHLNRYKRWRSMPSFRVTSSCSSLISGQMMISQVPVSVDLSKFTVENMAIMFPRSLKGVYNSTFEFQTNWMVASNILDTSITKDNVAANGLLVLSFPTPPNAGFAEQDYTVKITLEVSLPDLQLHFPMTSTVSRVWPGLFYTSYPHPASDPPIMVSLPPAWEPHPDMDYTTKSWYDNVVSAGQARLLKLDSNKRKQVKQSDFQSLT